MTVSTAVAAGIAWLADSQIRCQGEMPAAGGVCQGYDWSTQTYPFVYSEITGYAVSMYLCSWRWTGESRYLALAESAAEFLLRWQQPAERPAQGGAIVHGLDLPDLAPMKEFYAFDNAMILQGLLDLHAVTGDERLLAAGDAVGGWLTTQMQLPDGSFRSRYDAATGEVVHAGSHFYDDFGSLHAKHAIGLLKLWQATDNIDYRDAALAVCDWVLGLQDVDGAIRAHGNEAVVVSHPHCYAVEGLLYADFVLADARYRDAAVRAGQWLRAVQNSDGSINIGYKEPWPRKVRRIITGQASPRVTDATAQALRIWLALYPLTHDTSLLDAAQRAADYLRTMQCCDQADANAYGGFYFWAGHPIMFTWATMFAVHALHAFERGASAEQYCVLMTELF